MNELAHIRPGRPTEPREPLRRVMVNMPPTLFERILDYQDSRNFPSISHTVLYMVAEWMSENVPPVDGQESPGARDAARAEREAVREAKESFRYDKNGVAKKVLNRPVHQRPRPSPQATSGVGRGVVNVLNAPDEELIGKRFTLPEHLQPGDDIQECPVCGSGDVQDQGIIWHCSTCTWGGSIDWKNRYLLVTRRKR